jgi:hypothetical protein
MLCMSVLLLYLVGTQSINYLTRNPNSIALSNTHNNTHNIEPLRYTGRHT